MDLGSLGILAGKLLASVKRPILNILSTSLLPWQARKRAEAAAIESESCALQLNNLADTHAKALITITDAISEASSRLPEGACVKAGININDTLRVSAHMKKENDSFTWGLISGWNLMSLPSEIADNSIDAIFTPDIKVRTVYAYDPAIPGGWQVAVREELNEPWQGDLTHLTAYRGYWVLCDAKDQKVRFPGK